MEQPLRFALPEDMMATTATIPVNVSAEAAARIAELGMQREFEEMIEHAKQTAARIPGLRYVSKDELQRRKSNSTAHSTDE